ncbi:hypothetical protein BGZ76_003625 [Entomortierella beljakovae]|nr:hypothetical protein BGZ76_003625 [Entomortierella beljakovae]
MSTGATAKMTTATAAATAAVAPTRSTAATTMATAAAAPTRSTVATTMAMAAAAPTKALPPPPPTKTKTKTERPLQLQFKHCHMVPHSARSDSFAVSPDLKEQSLPASNSTTLDCVSCASTLPNNDDPREDEAINQAPVTLLLTSAFAPPLQLNMEQPKVALAMGSGSYYLHTGEYTADKLQEDTHIYQDLVQAYPHMYKRLQSDWLRGEHALMNERRAHNARCEELHQTLPLGPNLNKQVNSSEAKLARAIDLSWGATRKHDEESKDLENRYKKLRVAYDCLIKGPNQQ